MQSTEPAQSLPDEHRRILLDLAKRAIRHSLTTGQPLDVALDAYPPELRKKRGTFVTIERRGQLMGCIGTLRAQRPIVEDIAQNAWSALFRDPRCPRLTPEDAPDLDVHISLLTDPTPMTFSSEEDLLSQLRPGVDGLLLEDIGHRGTFLPSVWESLPDPRDFLNHLKRKAGLAPTYWSSTVRVSRYTADIVGDDT